MKLTKDPEGIYSVEFATQKGTTGSVCLETSNETEAKQKVEAMRVKELETVSGIVDLTHQVVTQIIAGKHVTVQNAISHWLDHALSTRTLSPTTVHTNHSQILAWATATGVLEKPLTSVTPKDISDYVNSGHERRTTALRHLSSIRQLFQFCCDEGLAIRNPASRTHCRVTYDVFNHTEKEHVEKGTFSPEDISRIKDLAPPFWNAAITLALDTGLRLGDICKLEWSCFKDGYITVWTEKSDKRVHMPITPAINDAMGSLTATDIQYCFPEQREVMTNPLRRANLSMQFSRLCSKAGLEGLSFHCLRHTNASNLVTGGKSLEEVAKRLGHGSVQITKNYVHVPITA